MRVHHLNCGTDCPLGGRLMDGRSQGALARLVCHCLLVETPNSGLVLVDTGYGTRDVAAPHRAGHSRITRTMRALLNIRLREEETAVAQIVRLGYAAEDVRHIVLTHLDFDHAGGLDDFPSAKVHLMDAEFVAATTRRQHWVARNRYRPAQFEHVKHWCRYAGTGESWLGFDAVAGLDGLDDDLLLIPLPGHTWGHAGVAVRTGSAWLLHAGDAYFHREEVRHAERRCPPGLRLYQRMMEVDRATRLANQARLRLLAQDTSAGVRVFCAHDAQELNECEGLSSA